MDVVVTLDCLDTDRLANFWVQALSPLNYRRSLDAPPYLSLVSDDGPTLLLQRVPEAKQSKNRMHLDLGVSDVPAEVKRMIHLGATVVSGDHTEIGYRWSVLQDPEGNEFCVFIPPTRS
jgi:predicted enzyme related to lactoylglutathione lyase